MNLLYKVIYSLQSLTTALLSIKQLKLSIHLPVKYVGTVSTFGMDIRFRNFTQFNANRETALVVEGASVEFYNISETIII